MSPNEGSANLKSTRLPQTAGPFATLAAEAADLSGTDLQHVRFDRADLGAANLSGALLDYANFAGANLAKVNLRSASLRYAILSAAGLGGANLSGADLRYARFDRADLGAANLSGALLDYADFAGANLAKVNLRGASLRYAKNLTGTQLEHCKVCDSTILPSRLQEPAQWSGARRATGTSSNRPVWTVGVLLLGALVTIGLVWQQLDQAGPSEPAPGGFQEGQELQSKAATEASPATPATAFPNAAIPGPDLLAESLRAPQLLIAVSPVLRHETRPGLSTGVSTPDPPPAAQVSAEVLAPEPSASSLTDILPTVVAAVPTTLVFAVSELAAEAKQHQSEDTLAETALAAHSGEPMTLVVSLNYQEIDVYRGTTLVASSKVSSGKPGYATKTGVFSILEKQRHHRSNLYRNAPMPWMLRLTWTGTALHGGALPGYPASHGCVRLPFSFAPKLFQMTAVGGNVVVASDKVAPKLIEHPNLFQPLPRPAQPSETVVASAASASFIHAAADDQAVVDGGSTAPLRILVTRRTRRDRLIDLQYLLSSMGHLTPQNFSGRLGTQTIAAIKAFQKANSLPQTGTFTDKLVKKVYEFAGKMEPPEGHLFVRQDFSRVFDLPVSFRNPQQALGTHVFTAMKFARGDAKAQWMAISLEVVDSASALDRIVIPDDVRRNISERLTPGSSLIIADTSINAAILPEGDDFLVLAKATPATADKPKVRQAPTRRKKARVKRAKVAPAVTKPRTRARRRHSTKRRHGRPQTVGRRQLYWR